MYGTIVAIEGLMATATIPGEPLVEPGLGSLLLVTIVAVAAVFLWLLGQGSRPAPRQRSGRLASRARGTAAPWNLHEARHPL